MAKAYSFMDVTASLVGPGGSLALGYGSANAKEGITVKAAGDKNKMLTGADGEGMHSLLADKSGKITLRYLKTSPLNAQLMALYDAQSMSSTLWGQNVITVSQTGVGDIHTGRQCAFTKRPDIEYKDEGDIIEWDFDVVKLDAILGTY